MTVDRTNPKPADFRPEPLPAEFEADVAEVDRLLTRALHTTAPSGLSQRVYEMSVRDLRSGASPSMRLADADVGAEVGVPASRRMVFTRSSLARLALAAAVLLAAGVALWQPWSPSVPTNPIANGSNGGGNGGSTVTLASVDLSDLDELADNNPSDLAAFEGQWSYILDAAELGSIDDLNHDLTLLVQQLEM